MLSLIPIIAALGLTVQAADSSDVDFVTRLVEDSKSHRKDYLRYIQTATVDIPAQFTSLAVKVQTYKDESYTTLIDADNINVQSLESFATNLPWYKERLAGSDSGSNSGSGSGSDSASTTKSGSSSTSKSGSSSSSSKSSSSTAGSSSSSGLGSSIVVPAGTTLAGLIVALL